MINETEKNEGFASLSSISRECDSNHIISQEQRSILNALPLNAMINQKSVNVGKPIEYSAGYDQSYYIERTLNMNIGDGTVKTFSKNDFGELIAKADAEKIIVISDEAGRGKSTFLTHLALKIKKLKPERWIVKINLHDHVEKFKSDEVSLLNTAEQIKEFVYSNFAFGNCVDPQISYFEKQLFMKSFDHNKVMVLLDGFDEISPFCDENVLNFIKVIYKLRTSSMCVTTRSHLRHTFERTLNTTCLELKAFTIEDQVDFLKRFWTKSFELDSRKPNENQLLKVANELTKRASRSLNDWNFSLLGVPLQVRMIAEVYKKSFWELLDDSFEDSTSLEALMEGGEQTLNVFLLFQDFVTLKTTIARSEKGDTISEDISAQETNPLTSINIVEVYQQLALKVIFNIKTEIPEHQIDLIHRYGIATVIDGNPIFIHRSFAEYFVATYIIQEMLKGSYETTALAKTVNLLNILTDDAFKVIRFFIENVLIHIDYEKCYIVNNYGRMGNFLAKSFIEANDDSTKSFMHQLINFKKFFTADFFLICLSHSDEFESVKKILWYQRRITFDPRSMLFSFTPETKFDEYSKKLGGNLLHCAVRVQVRCLVDRIWDLTVKIFGLNASEMFLKKCLTTGSEEESNVLKEAMETNDHYNFNFETNNLGQLKNYFRSGLQRVRTVKVSFYLENCVAKRLIEIAESLNLSFHERNCLVNEIQMSVTFNPQKHYIKMYLATTMIRELTPEVSIDKWFTYNPAKQNHFDTLVFYCMQLPFENRDDHILNVFENMHTLLYIDEFQYFTLRFFGRAYQCLNSDTNARKLFETFVAIINSDITLKLFLGNLERLIMKYILEAENREYRFKIEPHFMKVVTSYFNILSKGHLKLFLRSKSEKDFSLLQIITKNFSKGALHTFLKLIQDKLNNCEIREFLLQERFFKFTVRKKLTTRIDSSSTFPVFRPVPLLSVYHVNNYNFMDYFKTKQKLDEQGDSKLFLIVNFLKLNLSVDDVAMFISDSILNHHVIKNKDVLQNLLGFIEKILSEDEIKNILFITYNSNQLEYEDSQVALFFHELNIFARRHLNERNYEDLLKIRSTKLVKK